MGKQIINGDVEITGQLLKGDLKSLYHLGAYDSVDTTNADYDVGTKRGVKIPASAFTWYLYSTNEFRCVIDTSVYNKVAVSNKYPQGHSSVRADKTFWFEYAVSRNDMLVKDTTYSTLDAFKASLDGVYFEFQLVNSYTEYYLKNQPISTLDQAGENWLRGMYEKTLNLFSLGDLRSNFSVSGATVSTSGANLTDIWYSGHTFEAGSYTISFSSYTSSGNGRLYIVYTDGSREDLFSYILGDTLTFTTPADKTIARIGLAFGSSGTLTFSNPMLVKGTHALPYQPYNGKVMHAIDVGGVKLWENGKPDSDFAGSSITTADLSGYSKIVLYFKISSSWANAYQKIEFINQTAKWVYVSVANTANTICARNLRVNSNVAVEFSDGYTNGSVVNSSCVPFALYGIK